MDKLSIVAIVGLILTTGGMLASQERIERQIDNPGRANERSKGSYASQIETDNQIYSRVTVYQEKGLHNEAVAELGRIAQSNPENPLSYVYLAESYLAKGQLSEAIHHYRRAVEMEPDYVDPRTPKFKGDELKELVTEGIPKLEREKKLKPKDDKVKQALKDVYYLQRRLAGGCE